MIPSYPEFKRLELSDRAEYERGRMGAADPICELAFANLHIWREFDSPEVTGINGNICIRISPVHESPFFMQPVGATRLEETLRTCLADTGRVSRASASFVEAVKGINFAAERMRDHFDYVYRVGDLAELKGRRYDGKRNHIKRFSSATGGYACVALSAEHGEDALRVFRRWREGRDGCHACMGSGEEMKYCCQRRAVEMAFESFSDLGFFGSAMIVGGRLAGFMLATRLSKDTACVHLAYQSGEYPGTSQAMLWEGCRGALREFTFVNLEQDLGIPGLRRHKNSYYPVRMEEKYEITPRGPT